MTNKKHILKIFRCVVPPRRRSNSFKRSTFITGFVTLNNILVSKFFRWQAMVGSEFDKIKIGSFRVSLQWPKCVMSWVRWRPLTVGVWIKIYGRFLNQLFLKTYFCRGSTLCKPAATRFDPCLSFSSWWSVNCPSGLLRRSRSIFSSASHVGLLEFYTASWVPYECLFFTSAFPSKHT